MFAAVTRHTRACTALILLSLGLAACAPAPIYKTTAQSTAALPGTVMGNLPQYQGKDVIWGGRILSVANFSDHSEIDILAYPTDTSQRPILKRAANTRFIAVLPGFVEPMDYPAGAPITVSGKLVGTRGVPTGSVQLILPLVTVAQAHRWTPQEMDAGHTHFQFGIGAGVGFH
ncbi:Slp family lipoprotein [Frateuria aurantia]